MTYHSLNRREDGLGTISKELKIFNTHFQATNKSINQTVERLS